MFSPVFTELLDALEKNQQPQDQIVFGENNNYVLDKKDLENFKKQLEKIFQKSLTNNKEEGFIVCVAKKGTDDEGRDKIFLKLENPPLPYRNKTEDAVTLPLRKEAVAYCKLPQEYEVIETVLAHTHNRDVSNLSLGDKNGALRLFMTKSTVNSVCALGIDGMTCYDNNFSFSHTKHFSMTEKARKLEKTFIKHGHGKNRLKLFDNNVLAVECRHEDVGVKGVVPEGKKYWRKETKIKKEQTTKNTNKTIGKNGERPSSNRKNVDDMPLLCRVTVLLPDSKTQSIYLSVDKLGTTHETFVDKNGVIIEPTMKHSMTCMLTINTNNTKETKRNHVTRNSASKNNSTDKSTHEKTTNKKKNSNNNKTNNKNKTKEWFTITADEGSASLTCY